ncbi:short-chain dehydrogenase/reductase family protein [Favolaschia claudopus]|uniref:Short-chain dehydrogenase/reductase family protein n=1 Tax=Favolaschia claudopus TaxID=2862362 RepID=A0AAW0EC42_9AGAR
MPATILVTGASKGIGLAVTTILLRKFKANVVALSRTKTPEILALASESNSLVVLEGDVTDDAAVARAIDQATSTFNGLDGIVLNAATLAPLCRIGDDTPLENWKTHFDVNFFSLIVALKHSLPALRKSALGGRVVFVSSGAAVKGTAGWGPYNASKAAMNSLCRTLAEEEPDVISVALRPGMVQTDMQAALRQDGAKHMNAQDHQTFVAAHADGKLLDAHDPGHVIASLALNADKILSGNFLSWDSPDCANYRSTA